MDISIVYSTWQILNMLILHTHTFIYMHIFYERKMGKRRKGHGEEGLLFEWDDHGWKDSLIQWYLSKELKEGWGSVDIWKYVFPKEMGNMWEVIILFVQFCWGKTNTRPLEKNIAWCIQEMAWKLVLLICRPREHRSHR